MNLVKIPHLLQYILYISNRGDHEIICVLQLGKYTGLTAAVVLGGDKYVYISVTRKFKIKQRMSTVYQTSVFLNQKEFMNLNFSLQDG
jgi:hypothetical protein